MYITLNTYYEGWYKNNLKLNISETYVKYYEKKTQNMANLQGFHKEISAVNFPLTQTKYKNTLICCRTDYLSTDTEVITDDNRSIWFVDIWKIL